MTDLTEFLLARVAEDEADVRRAGVPHGTLGGVLDPDDGHSFEWVHRYGAHVLAARQSRVLAECEAKRAIVALHTPVWESQACDICDGAESEALGCAPADAGHWVCPSACGLSETGRVDEHGCDTLRALALPYVDHEDFRDEWRP